MDKRSASEFGVAARGFVSAGGTLIALAHTVEFSNIKARGDVYSKLGFTYEKRYRQEYAALLDSVRRLDGKHLEEIKGKANIQAELDEDALIIQAISTAIAAGTVNKSAIIKEVHERSSESTARVRKVLDKRTGNIYQLGHRWNLRKAAHNRHVYEILPTH